MAAVTAAMGGFLFGYDTGVISGALLFLSSTFALSTEMQGVVTSAVLAGACLAAGFGGWLADRFGRRFLMLDLALLFIIGALLSAFAGSVDALLVGRFLIGMCIGVVSFVAPLYIAEIAPPRHRGKLVSLNQLAITIGILVSYIVDTAYAAEGNWRWMLGLGAVPGILLAIGMAYLPESPRWLLKCGRETEAANVLTRVHGSADVIADCRYQSRSRAGARHYRLAAASGADVPASYAAGRRKPYSVSGPEHVVTLSDRVSYRELRQDGGAASAAIPSGRSSPSAGLGRPETRGFVPRLQSLNRRWMTKRYRSGWT
jgi:MFS family permease